MELQKEMTQYDDLVARHDAAYMAFTAMYTTKIPPPKMRYKASDNRMMKIGLAVQVIASMIVSASHTIPVLIALTPGLNPIIMVIVALAGFVMFEATAVGYSYRRTIENNATHNLQKLTNFGLGLVMVGAISANVYSTAKAAGFTHMAVDLLIAVLVGVSAPLLALISGDILGSMAVQDRKAYEEAATDHEAKLAEWKDGLNRSWSSQKAKLGIRLEVVEPDRHQTDIRRLSDLSVSEQTDTGRTRQSSYGFNRTPDGQAKVIEYLIANPEAAALPSRKLAELVGVGHDTANKGRNAWRDQQTKTE